MTESRAKSDEKRLSIILPASNEAGLIGACLQSVLNSVTQTPMPVEVIVIANACNDATARVARGFQTPFCVRGWSLVVVETATPGKLNALNHGDRLATGGMRAYLDADVILSPDLLAQLYQALDRPEAVYASGRVRLSRAESAFSRAYGRIYQQVPFMRTGVPGCGLFAVNVHGRKRWQVFPDIIADDTFVRLHFTPDERVLLDAPYDWPLVEGMRNLVKVRRRQDLGVIEIKRLFPELLANDDKPELGLSGMIGLYLRNPVDFMAYIAVALAVRLTGDKAPGSWSRGR